MELLYRMHYREVTDKGMRIGVDIDGVLTDIEQWQLDYGSKFYFEKYGKGIKDKDGYETSDIFNVEDKLDEEFWDEYLYDYAKNEPARKFAAEVIKQLRKDGNEIYIITSRFLTDRDDDAGEEMRNVVIRWLRDNDIIYDKIIFAKENKFTICMENNVSVMIEDNVENIQRISTKIPVICFHAGYNAKCEGSGIIRAYSWYDIYRKIELVIKPQCSHKRIL